ncbi:MAG: hypothetical protein M3273_00530 [Actinomycetota bacterium]|nr:hypothetical protein [Actinomycetota bacterium]
MANRRAFTVGMLLTLGAGLLMMYPPTAAAGAKSSLAYPIGPESGGGTIQLESVAGFAVWGGEGVIDPGGETEEAFTYDGIDRVTNELFGVRLGDGTVTHPAGTPVEATSTRGRSEFTPANDPPLPSGGAEHDRQVDGHTHSHSAVVDGTDGGGEVLPAPDLSWLYNHCVDSFATHSIRVVYVYDAVNDPGTSLDDSRVLDPLSKVREEIQAADRAISQSHDSFKQHMRIVCRRISPWEPWQAVDVASYAVPATADVNGDGFIACGEVNEEMRARSPYGRNAGSNRRNYWYFDSSVTGQRCSFGGVDILYSDPRSDDPGTGNIWNSAYGDAESSYENWSATGVSNRSVSVTLMEFHHSIGLLSTSAPSYCCRDAIGHSRDYPDFMNAGYCTPRNAVWDCADNEASEILTTCTLPAGLSYRDTYADCGRNDYWAPNAGTSNYLCNHYNLAWDSLYYHQRATPTSGCR